VKTLYYTTAFILAAYGAQAGNLVTSGLDDPHVNAPALPFSWDGGYAGLSYGQSQHKRTYTRDVAGVAFEQTEEPWETHSYSCNRGPDTNSHLRDKCDLTGLTHATELASLSSASQPWNTARDQTVRYTSSYDGLWLGADESIAFTLPEYVEPQARDGRWGFVAYETLRGVTVTEEAVTSYSQQEYTISESDQGFGGFAGYRNQWGFTPLVVGAEFNFIQTEDHGTFTQIGAQAGFAVGQVLPYVEVGADHHAGGTDIALGNVLLGVRTWASHNGDGSGNQVRVGWMF